MGVVVQAEVPDRPTPPDVVRSIVETLRSFWSLRAEPSPTPEEGVVWWTSGGHRRPLNGVLALSAADPGPIADRIAATFRLSGLPCAWLEGPDPSSPELGLRLLGLGYRTLEGSQGWALPLDEAGQSVPAPRGFLVRHGRESELVHTFSALVGEGALKLPASEIAPLESLLRPRFEYGLAPREEVWIGLSDGEPVTGVLTHTVGETVGLFGLATHPDQRGNGFATSVLLSALRSEADRGIRWAVAESPESHAGPYRRLGFQEYCDFRRYGWDPHASVSDGL